MAQSGAVITAEIVAEQEGTESLRGDFTLRFEEEGTPALSYNVTADEVGIERNTYVTFGLIVLEYCARNSEP